MAQPSKKTSAHSAHKPSANVHAAPKAVSHTANKAAAASFSALESTRNSAESMLRIGTDKAKEFFASGSEEAQKAHEKIFAMGRGNAENLSRAVDAFTHTLNDLVNASRENIDAAVEVNHIAADIAKSINAELVSCANTNFSDNVELCKEAFACRDVNDAFDLQSKFLSTNMDNFFTQSTRLAEMLFQLATEAAEPINERVAEATERFSKSLAA
jgi:phasin family protein